MPRMSNVDEILNQLREALKEELRAEVRAEIIAELGGKATPVKPAKSAPSLSQTASKLRKTATSLKQAVTTSLKVKKGQRRSEEDVAAAADTLLTWFKLHPESSIAAASSDLKVPAKDLDLPLAKLLDDKKLKKQGERRWTTYTAKG